jgi:hypothetical protein
MLLGLMGIGGLSLLTAAVWLAYLNRSSEMLRSNGVTAVVVGVAGLLATLWFSLKAPEARHHQFPVVFVLDAASRLPLPPWESLVAAPYADPATGLGVLPPGRDRLKAEIMRAAQPGDIDGLLALYLDVMVSYFMDALGRTFSTSWDVEVSSFETAQVATTSYGPRAPLGRGLSLPRRELVANVPRAQIVSTPGFAETLTVPPGTHAVGWEAKDARNRVLRLSNPFVTLRVEIATWSYGIGAGGLAPLVGMSQMESQEKMATLSYLVSLDASFERLRSGHPDMPDYVRWVDTLFGQLRRCDAEQRWRRMKEDYVLLRDLQAGHQRDLGGTSPNASN